MIQQLQNYYCELKQWHDKIVEKAGDKYWK